MADTDSPGGGAPNIHGANDDDQLRNTVIAAGALAICVAVFVFMLALAPMLALGTFIFQFESTQNCSQGLPLPTISPTPAPSPAVSPPFNNQGTLNIRPAAYEFAPADPAPTPRATPPSSVKTSDGYTWNTTQLQVAQTIINVGASMGIDTLGQTIGVMAGMDESHLTNLPGGDRDSSGVFQQRPSMGWGSYAQVTDVTHAATSFFSRLQGVPYSTMKPWAAAQQVQRSGDPTGSNYEKYWGDAQTVVAVIGGGIANINVGDGQTCGDGGLGVAPGGTDVEQAILDWAQTAVGKPYWNGKDSRNYTVNEPTMDCSTFVGYALYMATGQVVGGVTGTTASEGPWLESHNLKVWSGPASSVNVSTLTAGQIIEYGTQANPYSQHIEFYAGNGNIIGAHTAGKPASVEAASFTSYWSKTKDGNYVTIFNPPAPVSGTPTEPGK